MGVTAFINKLSRICGSRKPAWLLLVNIGVALLLWVTMVVLHLANVSTDILYRYVALPSSAMEFVFRPWTLVTYMFVHFSPLHLLFNMLWLFWFGSMLANTGHDRRLIRLFIIAGVTGGVAYVTASALTDYSAGSYLTGSSAAVLGLMCYAAVCMPDHIIRLFIIGNVKLKWVALVCVLLTLIGGATAIPTQCAHLGGIVTGLAYRWIGSAARNHKGQTSGRRSSRRVRKAMPTQAELNERLDYLLDKIRLSGFDSLSEREKSELNYLSAVIDSHSANGRKGL